MSDLRVRRVTTGHDEHGRAVFLADELIEGERLTIPLAKGAQDIENVTAWETAAVPADNSGPVTALTGLSPDAAGGDVFHSGIVFRIVELPAGSSSPMHRTLSVDYGILLKGECDLVLDDGATAALRAGDVVIQRGTIHSWVNRSAAPCVWAWILIDASPAEAAGATLPAEWGEAPDLD